MLKLNRSGYCAALGLGLALAGFAVPSYGDLILEAPNVQAAPGSSGSFDLLIVDTDPAGSPSYAVAGISEELAISGTGVTFTNATTATVTPYVFLGHSLDDDSSSPPSFSTFPTNDLIASDADDLPFQSIAPGESFGLLQVSYTVTGGATPGPRDLTIEGVSDETTVVVDENANLLPFSTIDGSLIVTATPEPATAALLALGFPVFLRRRRGRNT